LVQSVDPGLRLIPSLAAQILIPTLKSLHQSLFYPVLESSLQPHLGRRSAGSFGKKPLRRRSAVSLGSSDGQNMAKRISIPFLGPFFAHKASKTQLNHPKSEDAKTRNGRFLTFQNHQAVDFFGHQLWAIHQLMMHK
jgi:hypothetical protein